MTAITLHVDILAHITKDIHLMMSEFGLETEFVDIEQGRRYTTIRYEFTEVDIVISREEHPRCTMYYLYLSPDNYVEEWAADDLRLTMQSALEHGIIPNPLHKDGIV